LCAHHRWSIKGVGCWIFEAVSDDLDFEYLIVDSTIPRRISTPRGETRVYTYDADPPRQTIAAKGAIAVITNNPSRALKYPLDKHLYAQRHLVECCFSKLKQFRRVATRFEKTARNYRAVVTLAAIILSIR
jgi:hypothetical protein